MFQETKGTGIGVSRFLPQRPAFQLLPQNFCLHEHVKFSSEELNESPFGLGYYGFSS